MVDRKRSTDRYADNIRTVREFLDRLTEKPESPDADWVSALVRMGEETAIPDGYPSGGSGDGGRSTSDDTPTERAALRGLPDEASTEDAYWTTNAAGERVRTDQWHRHNRIDPVAEQIAEILGNLVEMAGLAGMGKKKLAAIRNRPQLLEEKEKLMDRCNACQRFVSGGEPVAFLADDIEDPLDIVAGHLRSGYCSACASAWDRQGRPDRPAFERMRLERHTKAKACSTEPAGQPVGV